MLIHSEERNECRCSPEITAYLHEALFILSIETDKPRWMVTVSTSYSSKEKASPEVDPGLNWSLQLFTSFPRP